METPTTAKTTSTQLFGVLYITLTGMVDTMVSNSGPWSLLGQYVSYIIKLAPILWWELPSGPAIFCPKLTNASTYAWLPETPPAADMGDTMKKLSEKIASLHMYLTSGDKPKSNHHFTSYCKQNCNYCGNEGHPFIYCPTLRAPEAKALTSEAKPLKIKSSKPKKEANASSAKEETYPVESLATVRSNVTQKHHLSQKVHPYSTPGKTKGSELLKSESVNHESPAAGDHPHQQDELDVPQQAPAAEPYGVPMDEDGTYNEAPTIEVQKSPALKTSSQKSQQTKKPKPKPAVPLIVVKPPKFNVWKTLTDTYVPISLYNLAEIASSKFNVDQTALLDLEEDQTIVIVSKVAPKINSEVERHPMAIILDRGSTSNIISEAFLGSLGLKEYSFVKEKFTFANGKTKECLGFVKDLTVEICGVRKLVSAAIFQLTCYNLLIDCHVLSKFRISVSFKNHELFIQCENTLFPIDICYTSPHNEGESFMAAVEAIRQNKGLTSKQRKKINTYVKQYQDLICNEDDPLTPANLERHVIDTENHCPICSAP
ncbi:hypothetical protein DSO57_1008154 [Entomophthora muscae]|uniref:Uncharacterized protein n=1 Tax=Entomophthora muscae TaxID=34485 RepID=A0ACC2T741_9FUNG|nr:hypothetical protein DSO57_1008154 [Entomophthora muscae]